MIRVVVTGSECTGKTTLARGLAEHYGAPWVPEYARRFVEERGRAPEAGDVEAIARGQLELEDRVATRAGEILVLDTDLLSTVVYSRHYYGDCPSWIEGALRRRRGDLYLLAGLDVEWVADGAMRDRGTRRDEIQGLFRAALEEFECPLVEIEGPPATRVEKAVTSIDRLGSS